MWMWEQGPVHVVYWDSFLLLLTDFIMPPRCSWLLLTSAAHLRGRRRGGFSRVAGMGHCGTAETVDPWIAACKLNGLQWTQSEVGAKWRYQVLLYPKLITHLSISRRLGSASHRSSLLPRRGWWQHFVHWRFLLPFTISLFLVALNARPRLICHLCGQPCLSVTIHCFQCKWKVISAYILKKQKGKNYKWQLAWHAWSESE